ncbi:MAG: hypothetical protein KGZ42_11320 [Melioribacter sp.]|nr:hypothetical protein [Melioribacter sp.]
MKIPKRDFALLTVIYLVSASIRLFLNFSTEFFPGANGAFYLANVRSIIESGEILFKDFPLIFYLEALLAKLFILIGIAGVEGSIDLACRLFDSFIPALAIIPAYYLAHRLSNVEENKFTPIVTASISILYISFLILVSDFQKNSLGIVWLFGLMLWTHKSMSSKRIADYLITILFFVLTGITHFGCFLVTILYVIILALIKNIIVKKISIKFTVISISLIIISYIIILLISPSRLKTVFDFVNNAFRDPVIILFLQKKPVISPIDLVNIILTNLIAISALLFYIKRFQTITEVNKIFYFSSIILSLILAFPFIGFEWSQRLTFISYVPAVSLIPFILNNIRTPGTKKIVYSCLIAVVFFSIVVRINIKPISNMNRDQFNELNRLKENLPSDGRVLMVARHGLEWWASYILRMPVVRETALEKVYWERFDYILFIIQKKGKAPFGPTGLFGPPFREPFLTVGSRKLFDGYYYSLYWSPGSPADMSVFNERIK